MTEEPPKISAQEVVKSEKTTKMVVVEDCDIRTVPQVIYCPYCGDNKHSMTIASSGRGTWVAFTLIFFVLPGCCLLPFFMDRCKDVEHYCYNCGEYLGVNKMCC